MIKICIIIIMYIYIVIGIILFLLAIFIIKKKNTKKPNKKYKKKKLTKIIPFSLQKKNYDMYNIIPNSFLTLKIDNQTHFLTWRYSGENIRNKKTYNLVLLPYKNKQNEFKIHLKDYRYLKQFYEIYGLFHTDMIEKLNSQVIAESEYNQNKEQYLELEKNSDNLYYVRASLWLEKGPNSYLHLDDKNKLYFDQGIINKNIAVFDIV